jgi:hypothetical protein
MDLILSSSVLYNIIDAAYTEGSRKTLELLGKEKAFYSQREAEKIYGKTKFQSWIKSGKIYPVNQTPPTAGNKSKNHKKSYLISDCEKCLAADEFKIKIKRV